MVALLPPLGREAKITAPEVCSAPPEHRPRLQGISVLLAEDAPDNQFLITRLLRLEGACVDVAVDGAEGHELAWYATQELSYLAE